MFKYFELDPTHLSGRMPNNPNHTLNEKKHNKVHSNKAFSRERNRSIIAMFLSGTPNIPGHCKVNLPQIEAAKSKGIPTSIRKVDIQYKTKLTQTSVTRSIHYLETRNANLVLDWIDDFENIARSAQWEEDEKVEMLHELITAEHYPDIQKKNSTDAIKKYIIQIILPIHLKDNLFIDLFKVKQTNYTSITDYAKNIQIIARKYSAAISAGIKEQKNIEDQAFNQGLTLETSVYLQGKNSHSFDEKLESLIQLENTILSKTSRMEDTRQSQTHALKSISKYCSYHKVRTHSNAECRARQTETQMNHTKNKHNLNAIQEQNKKVDILTMNGEIDNKSINVLLDTGTSLNFISENIVNSVKTIETYTEKKSIILPDGKEVEVHKSCKFQFKLEAIKTHYYKIKAFILPTKTNTLILGTNFLAQERAIINYRDGIINLDGIELEMPGYSILNSEPESILINASNYCNMIRDEIRDTELKSAKVEVSQIIRDYKTDLPKIGRIPKIQHEINTFEKKIIAKKTIPCAF